MELKKEANVNENNIEVVENNQMETANEGSELKSSLYSTGDFGHDVMSGAAQELGGALVTAIVVPIIVFAVDAITKKLKETHEKNKAKRAERKERKKEKTEK